MKKLINTTLALLTLVSLPTIAHSELVSGNVDQVTVFTNRAQVVRKHSFLLEKGAQTVTFKGLTKTIRPDSIRVRIGKGSDTQVLSVRTKKVFVDRVRDAELDKLRVRREKIDAVLKDIYSRAQTLRKEYDQIIEVASHFNESFALNLHRGKWTAKDFRSYMNFNQKKVSSVLGVWQKLYEEFESRQEEKELIVSRIRQLSSKNSKSFVDVEIDLISPLKRKESVSLEYHVSGAGWSPIYDLRISSKRKTAGITHSALIWQNTGEDWKNSRILLSNVQSEIEPKLPTLSQMMIRWREVEKVKTNIVSKSEVNTVLSQGDSSSTLDGDLFSKLAQEFTVKGRQTIGTGQGAIKLAIATVQTKYTENLELVAAQLEHVYRRGRLINEFDWRLSAGPADIYYDGKFIQRTSIPNVTKKAPFHINAGINFDVKVNRTATNKRAEGRLLAGKSNYLRSVKNWLTNYSDQRLKVRVYEQFPDSEIKEVTVKRDGSTEGFVEDKENPSWGYWTLRIPSNSTQMVQLELDVSVPSEMNFRWAN